MPYHENHELSRLYSEMLKAKMFKNQSFADITDIAEFYESATSSVITSTLNPFLQPILDKTCGECGSKNACYHVYCWFCGNHIGEIKSMKGEK